MKKIVFAFPLALSLVACSSSGTTVSGSTGAKINISQAAQIGCALAQVVGDTAGQIAGDVNSGSAAANGIVIGRKVLDDACAALNKIAPVIDAKGSSVSATVTPK